MSRPRRWAAQALLADLARSPAGRLRALQGRPLQLEAFLESVEEQPMASASIAQVAFPSLRCTRGLQVHGGLCEHHIASETPAPQGRPRAGKMQDAPDTWG